ncbi:MarR family winged helix-turn-helix transcriptional regulator [Palleronia sp. KMU-117]|uniref:MarR family winged helix-turn-helix transcriptional regulator n=1 Tax=Palleronia sp. KMU-117 TaxID=3434108 RepID=UPI003D73664E
MIPSELSRPDPEDSVTHLVADWARERPDFDPLPIGVFARIHRLSSHLSNRTKGWLEAEGLTWEAFSLIATLRRQGPPYEMRPTDILRESLLTSGAVTNRIDRVEQMGLVERRADLEDGRASLVRLTKKGLDAANAAIEVHQAHLWEVFGVLGGDELRALDAMLARTLALMEASGGGRDDA